MDMRAISALKRGLSSTQAYFIQNCSAEYEMWLLISPLLEEVCVK